MDSINVVYRAIISIITFALLIIIMILIEKPLFDASINLIKTYSNEWDTSNFAAFMKKYTNWGTVIICSICALYSLLTGPKIKQIMFINTVMLGWVLCSFLKNIHHALRPFWAEKSVPVISNENDYGNPSGHTSGSGCCIISALLLYLLDNYDFCLNDFEKDCVTKRRTGIIYNFYTKIIITVLAGIAYLLIVYSRVYLGAHSMNQVLYGIVLASFCVFVIFKLFRKELIDFYNEILVVHDRTLFGAYLISFVTIVGGILAAQIIAYAVLNLTGVELDSATLSHIRENFKDFDKGTPLNAGLVNSGLGCLVIGVHIGLVISARFFTIEPTRISINVSMGKQIGRMIFMMAMIAPLPIVAYVYLPSYPPLGCMWFKSVIPSLVMGFMLFGLGDYLMLRIGGLPKLKKDELKEISIEKNVPLLQDQVKA